MANGGRVEGLLRIITVLQLDWFCRKQGKWVEVAYVLLFFSLRNMPDLWPKGIDLGVKRPAPSCPPRWRTGDKEIRKSRFLQSIPGIICAEKPERLRNSHTSYCLFMKHVPGEIISLWQLISLLLIKKYKESRRIWKTSEDPEKYIRAFKGVTLLYDLTWNDVMYISGQMLTPDSESFGKSICLWRWMAW